MKRPNLRPCRMEQHKMPQLPVQSSLPHHLDSQALFSRLRCSPPSRSAPAATRLPDVRNTGVGHSRAEIGSRHRGGDTEERSARAVCDRKWRPILIVVTPERVQPFTSFPLSPSGLPKGKFQT